MYDTRWPRPGPAMAAACAAVGLLVGIAVGLSSGGNPEAEARVSPETTGRRVATTLPDDFWTVILASPRDRSAADAAVATLKAQGVRGVGVISKADFPELGTPYAVYSGRFDSSEAAEEHADELPELGNSEPFVKHVIR
jgi:SPOR domain